MYISPAQFLFESSLLSEQALFLNEFLLPRHSDLLDKLIDHSFISKRLYQHVPGTISILAFGLNDFYLNKLVGHFLADTSVEKILVCHYSSEIVNPFSANPRVDTILYDTILHEDFHFSCSSFSIPFNESISGLLLSLLDQKVPFFEDSLGNIHFSILGLCLSLNVLTPEVFDQLLQRLSDSLQPLTDSTLKDLSGPHLVTFYSCISDYPPSRLVDFSSQSIFDCLPAEAISKDIQYVSARKSEKVISVGSHSVHNFKLQPCDFLPYMFTVFLNKGGGGNNLMSAVANSLSCPTIYAEDYLFDTCGIPFVWGVLRNSKNVIDFAVHNHRHFMYADHAYFNRGHGKSYRISANSFECNTYKVCPSDRRKLFDVECHPWNKSGSEIIVCPPTEYFVEAHKVYGWLDNTISELKKFTDRKIIVRTKPKPGDQILSLSDQLQSAHALVTHSSNVAIEAICCGTPVFVSDTSAARVVGLSDLSSIENPIYLIEISGLIILLILNIHLKNSSLVSF